MSRHHPGTTRRKLAEILCRETGALFEAHDICQNNNRTVHYEDCCRWDAWGLFPKTATLPPIRLHVYSWDQMGRCVRWRRRKWELRALRAQEWSLGML